MVEAWNGRPPTKPHNHVEEGRTQGGVPPDPIHMPPICFRSPAARQSGRMLSSYSLCEEWYRSVRWQWSMGPDSVGRGGTRCSHDVLTRLSRILAEAGSFSFQIYERLLSSVISSQRFMMKGQIWPVALSFYIQYKSVTVTPSGNEKGVTVSDCHSKHL